MEGARPRRPRENGPWPARRHLLPRAPVPCRRSRLQHPRERAGRIQRGPGCRASSKAGSASRGPPQLTHHALPGQTRAATALAQAAGRVGCSSSSRSALPSAFGAIWAVIRRQFLRCRPAPAQPMSAMCGIAQTLEPQRPETLIGVARRRDGAEGLVKDSPRAFIQSTVQTRLEPATIAYLGEISTAPTALPPDAGKLSADWGCGDRRPLRMPYRKMV